jgi:hypothetical protein
MPHGNYTIAAVLKLNDSILVDARRKFDAVIGR